MKFIKVNRIYDKKEWACGCELEDNLLCGEYYGWDKIAICDKCFERLSEI